MNAFPSCPKCASEYTYPQDLFMVCPDCGYEWDPNAAEVGSTDIQVLDANGTILQNGDSVIVLKNLPVKGAAKPIKAGTKVKSIKLVEGDHNIECKIDGFGSMALKSEFVRKA
ncbi:MAG: alkylphosphonate utilization protein [Flavobacteriales bacterium]|nr:alkylphosphonate utilization protein [Flavobacteriales bacterium]